MNLLMKTLKKLSKCSKMKIDNFVVTGANSDIGKALIARLSINDQNKILAVSRSKNTSQSSSSVEYLDNVDLNSEDDLITFSEKVKSTFSDKFVLIHSVGNFWDHKTLTDTQYGEAVNMMDSHYNTLYGCIKYLIPIFKQLNGGRIIAFSCNSVGFNYPEMAAFTSAKAAVETLIKCTANENSKYGIVANAIALSTIKTEKVINSKLKKYHNQYITEQELLEVVDNLINASSLINGNIIRILKHSEYFYNEGYFQRNPSISSD